MKLRLLLPLLLLALLTLLVLACGQSMTRAERGLPGLKLIALGRFHQPLLVTAPPGDQRRVMVVEQHGVIRLVRGDKVLRAPYLDLRSRVKAGGEQGLLGLAFAPDYARSGRLYVYFTERSGSQAVWEFHRQSADQAAPRSGRLVLRMPDRESNHNGGHLSFGPDRLLYIGTGDGGGAGDQHGSRGNAQSRSSLLGKILRIDPRRSGSRPYTIPPSNPFVSVAGARPEIYAYGLRNPWRFSFDRQRGDLIIADVGQNEIEEINFARRGQARGANYGWRVWEGRRRYAPGERAPGAVFPVIAKRHSGGWCSITGGYIIRDRTLPASLRGRYLYGDFCKGQLRAARLRTGQAGSDRALDLPTIQALSSFGEDARGRLYVVSLTGPVYRLARR